jgi:limonene-1,2-epoxide hydrolase
MKAVSLALLLGLAVLAAGCGGSSPSAESVVRAWSQALNMDDNRGAANLFAPNAEIVQGTRVLRLRTHADAVAWNSALPCSGEIVAIRSHGQTATATFRLGDRQHSRCDGPGQRATAIFRVVKGKIVLWHQTGTPVMPLNTLSA